MDVAIRSRLVAQSLPPPSSSLITSLTSRSPLPPLPSLVATAKARLLAADLTASTLLDTSQMSALPDTSTDVQIKKASLTHDTHVQVLDVEDLNCSRWQQIEELEAVERGETTRGRQVIRVTDDGDGGAGTMSTATNATHRLVLQDCKGTRVYGVELKRVQGVGVGRTCIGAKMLLRAGTVMARGTLLLTPDDCVLLGGKIDAWHDAWLAGRMARLKEAVGSEAGIH